MKYTMYGEYLVFVRSRGQIPASSMQHLFGFHCQWYSNPSILVFLCTEIKSERYSQGPLYGTASIKRQRTVVLVSSQTLQVSSPPG